MIHSGYLIRRTGQAVITVVAVVTISFAMIRMLPGGPGMLQCMLNPGGAAGGGMSAECTAIMEQGTSTVPIGELAVLGGFVLVLLLVSTNLWKDY